LQYYWLSLRLGEIVALIFSDIEVNYLNIQRIKVKEQIQKTDGSWNISKYIVVDNAKTKAELQKVYFTSKAREIIELIRKLNLGNGYNNDEFFFLNDKGRIHVPSLTYRRKKCCKKAGISKKS
jgi:integrase